MTCREVLELLLEYVNGELPPDRREHVRHHLECCPPCVTYIETYQVTIRLTRQLPSAPLPPQLLNRLQKAAAELKGERQGGKE